MRVRLPRDGEIDYQVERHNDAWADHQARTLVTAALIAWLKPNSALDPACGDASILSRATGIRPIDYIYLNDVSKPNIDSLRFAAGLRLAMTDTQLSNLPIEQYMEQVTGKVDVIVLTETLEHLVDPDSILRAAKRTATWLVASSPIMRPGQTDTNPEHLWQFDQQGYEDMLNDAGWYVEQYTFLHFPTEYDFGVWVCR